jgi:CRISPR-associated endonuclease/helicase Cas3
VDPLIEDVYREADSPTHLAEALRLAWDEGRRESHRKRHENEQSARGLRILPPFYPDDLLAYRKNVLEEDDPDIHRSLQALTRLSDPTVSVVCLYGTEDAATLESGGRGTIDLRAEPDRDLTRSLLERSVTLSHKGLVHWLLDQGLTPSGWSRCALLRYHRVIFLDAANQATMGKLTLNVHDEEGIIIKGGEKRHETQLQSGG